MSELIYGRHTVMETLRANRRRLFRLWLEGENEPQAQGIIGEICAAAAEVKLPVHVIKGGLFEKLAQEKSNAQGVALEAGDYPYAELTDCLDLAVQQKEPPLFLILDHLQDPQNLGTLIRTADTVGVHGVILTRPPFGPHYARRDQRQRRRRRASALGAGDEY